jgi:hypothetical protein
MSQSDSKDGETIDAGGEGLVWELEQLGRTIHEQRVNANVTSDEPRSGVGNETTYESRGAGNETTDESRSGAMHQSD